jgi:hypothetical protein
MVIYCTLGGSLTAASGSPGGFNLAAGRTGTKFPVSWQASDCDALTPDCEKCSG